MDERTESTKEQRREPPPEIAPHCWKPGQSGNPGGRPKGKSITASLNAMLEQGLDGKDLAEAMARIAYRRALKGDSKFWQLIVERLDGKAPEKLEVTGVTEVHLGFDKDG